MALSFTTSRTSCSSRNRREIAERENPGEPGWHHAIADRPGVTVTGAVSDVKPFLANAGVVLGPELLRGHGTLQLAVVLGLVVGKPLGVVGVVAPWNYPLMMAAWKAAANSGAVMRTRCHSGITVAPRMPIAR